MGLYEALEASPSQQRNFYISTFILTMVAFVVAVVVSTKLTWTLFSPIEWISVDHFDYLKSCGFTFIDRHEIKCYSYLNAAMAGDVTKSLFIYHAVAVFVISSIVAVSVFLSMWSKDGSDALRHIEGSKLFYGLSAILKAQQKSRLERKKDNSGKGIFIHKNIQISEKRLHQNMFFLGMPGSGKTTLINPIIKQAIERKNTCIIYDEKKEFTSLFYDADTTILIAPFDHRSAQWNIAADVKNLAQAKAISESMIDVNEKEPLWGQAARLILIGAMMHCINNYKDKWGWKELSDFISLDEASMSKALQQSYPAAAKLVVEGSKTTQSLLINLTTSLSWLDSLDVAWPSSYKTHNSISINSFLKNTSKRKILIIQNDTQYSTISDPIINVFITLLTNNLLAMNNSQKRKVWLFLDELGNLRKNPSILKWLSLARSKGGIMVAGTQSLSMLYEIFGKNITDSIGSMIGTLICLRVSGTGDTAQFISDSLGKRRVERPQNVGTGKVSWQTEELPVVPVSAITGQPQASIKSGIHGFLSVVGWNDIYKLNWDLKIFPKIAEESIPADWTQPSFKPPSQNNKTDSDIEISQVDAVIENKPTRKIHQDIRQDETIVETFFEENKTSEKVFDGDISKVNVLSDVIDSALGLGGATTVLEALNEHKEVNEKTPDTTTASSIKKVKKNRLKKRREFEEEQS